MRLFEYAAKQLLQNRGLRTPRSVFLSDERNIQLAAQELGLPFVLKAQTLIGGRGKAGGIQIVHSEEEAAAWCSEMEGKWINGKKVEGILIEEYISIEQEYYLGFTIDTVARKMKILFSPSGGVDVEQTNQLYTYEVNIDRGLEEYKIIEILSRTGVDTERWTPMIEMIRKLYGLFEDLDCRLLEINPLVWTCEKELQILDVHLYVDDNALYRQPEIKQMVSSQSETYEQILLKLQYGFDFVVLNPEGTVGLLTTGAGLTMALVDELTSRQISPINFSDVRSGQLKGDPTRLIVMLEKLSQFSSLEYILVSIFAGVTDLGEFAISLLKAKEQVTFLKEVKWVIRLEGNNFRQAKELLTDAGLFITNSLNEAIEVIETELIG